MTFENLTQDADRVLIDIDGPEITLAIVDRQRPDQLRALRVYKTDRFPTATDCIMEYGRESGIQLAGSQCVIVASGAHIADTVRIARCPWIISVTGFRYLFQNQPFVLNDTAAMLWAATQVSPASHRSVDSAGLPDFQNTARWLGINYFRGLGAAILLPDEHGGLLHVESEAGHCAFSASDEEEQQLSINLGRIKQPVSWERALHSSEDDMLGNDSTRTVKRPNMPLKKAAMLGSFVGDTMLATGTWGGVFLFKAAANLLQSAENLSVFRRRMSQRANFGVQLRQVPIYMVEKPNINLVGAAAYLDARLTSAMARSN
jgi:glucokinase